jgi:hypothetical protein
MNKSHSLAIANIIHLAEKLGYHATDEFKINTVYPNGEKYRGRIDVVIFNNDCPIAFIEVETPTFLDKTISKSIGTPNPQGYLKHKSSTEFSRIKLNSIKENAVKIIINSVKANELTELQLNNLLKSKRTEILEIF